MPAWKIGRFAAAGSVAGAEISEKTCSVRRLAPFLLAFGGTDGYGPPRLPGPVSLPAAAHQIRARAFPAALPKCEQRTKATDSMADKVVPHFHNTPGVAVIEIGAHEFMCEGEVAPFDHPHVYLDMGDATEIICPYCSTLFRLDPTLDPHAARPAECALADGVTA
jgi:uncharacterized Zn-finger protein